MSLSANVKVQASCGADHVIKANAIYSDRSIEMKREDLKKVIKDISDEQIDAIMKIHGKDIETHKTKVTTLESERDTLKEQLVTANGKISSFEQMDPEKLKAEVEEWKVKAAEFEAKVEDTRKAGEAEVAKIQYEHDLTEVLKNKYLAKDPQDLMPRLDHDKITRTDGGELIGLKEQLEPIMEEKSYLFDEAEDGGEGDDGFENTQKPTFVKSSKGKKVTGSTFDAALRKGAGLTEQKGD